MGKKLKYNFIYRCTVIVWMVIKFIFQIYLFHMKHRILDERSKKKWDALLIRQAIEYREKAIRLGGVLIKAGQFLSMRTDFMPKVFIQELTGLVDRVPADSFAYASSIMEKEWGGTPFNHLQAIDKVPIASASIGEVYRATLKDGTDVAIKIQRYRIEEVFHMDFKVMRIVFWIISVFTSFGKKADLQALYRELIYVMDRELDFEQELSFGIYFKERYKHNRKVYIPAYYEELCTKKILVMEWIEGTKITDLDFLNKHQINRKSLAKTIVDFYFDQYFHEGYFHADPHSGNIIVDQYGKITIIDFGMVGMIRKIDVRYFKCLLQGFIIDDYDGIIDTLEEMNFILLDANKQKLKKMIKQTFDLYDSGAFKKVDAKVMDLIKDDIRLFIKEQPIQLSAEYAFLGRAISIIIGILITLHPDIDIGSWVKPKIKQWLGSRNLLEAIYNQKTKEVVQPIISFPRAMINWLENGEKDRKWEKLKQQRQHMHHLYILLELILFTMLMGNSFMVFYEKGVYIGMNTGFGILFTGIIFLVLIIVLKKHHKMIKQGN